MRPSIRPRRRIRRSALRLNLTTGVLYRRLIVYLRGNRTRLHFGTTAALVICFGSLLGYVLLRHRSDLRTHAEALSANGTLPQMGIAVGAAMLGVIGIVFSLSIFSIHHVAERGTLLTLREYANDWLLRLVYWSLASFAFLAVFSALLVKRFAPYSLALNLAIVIAAVLLLKLYFNRAIEFSDPHFTVSKIAKRATKFLAGVRRMERAAEAEIRYARRRVQP